MMKKPLDISEMTLDWVWQTEDPFFADLERSDRHLLYLVFVKEMDRQGIADSLGGFPGSAGGYPLAHALEVLRHLLR